VILCEGRVAGHPSLEELGAGASGLFTMRNMDRDDPAAILYTSGTTGKQKGSVLSHGNVVSNMYSTGHALRVDPTDRLLLFLPLFHCFGQNFIMNTALNSGAAIVLHRRFVPEEILSSVARNGVTMFFAVPTVYIALLNAPVEPDHLAGIRYYFSAAATLPVEIAARWQERFGHPIYEGYGLTETSPFASYNYDVAFKPGSVVTPIENVEMKIVDAADHEVADGELGEIVIKGPNVMKGYFANAAASAEAIREGWFHSGDIGYRDADGYFFIVDRVKDMINVSGFKVFPREVEEVLFRHAAVKEAAVVGIADPVRGEAVKAFVVLVEGARASVEELQALCRAAVADYKVPGRIEFVPALPKNPTGKVLKKDLRTRG